MFILLTGLSWERAAGVEWNQIDLISQQIRITDSVTVPITNALAPLIERRIMESRVTGNSFVFGGRYGDRRLGNNLVSYRRACRRFDVNLSVKDIRAIFSAVAYLQGFRDDFLADPLVDDKGRLFMLDSVHRRILQLARADSPPAKSAWLRLIGGFDADSA